MDTYQTAVINSIELLKDFAFINTGYNWKFFIISAKIPNDKFERLKDQIIHHHGKIVDKTENADLILTALRSLSRIRRNLDLESFNKPIICIDWVEACHSANKRLPYNGYIIAYNPDYEEPTTDESIEIGEEKSIEVGEEERYEVHCSDLEEKELDPRFLNTRYLCFRPTPLYPKFNKELIELLEELEKVRRLNNEQPNVLAYRRAIAALKAYPRELESYQEARKIIGIGAKIGRVIKTYMETGTIPEVEEIKQDEKFQILDLFSHSFGVGYKTATAWYLKGYRTIEDCKKDPKLNNMQKIGLELYDDLQKKMSRKDVEEIFGIFEREVKDALGHECIITPVGGYRRGKEFNGDFDVIISHPVEEMTKYILKSIVERLKEKGFITDIFWYGEPSAKDKIPPSTMIKRIDIIIASRSQYATALVGWTGSRLFLRSLKDYARKEKEMILASHGLFHNTFPRQKIDTSTEEDVFKILGVPWVDPTFRNC
ncbi:4281_t:CDS:10 [Diversispora eburnea]|uniref:DNA polymerase n=1 Tax=Diversispora eburnea TaxID=1213867 RepID=A0A9N9BLH3_9GLOM|nr:4281_t:CDS:10 [Diversispora eburnea]